MEPSHYDEVNHTSCIHLLNSIDVGFMDFAEDEFIQIRSGTFTFIEISIALVISLLQLDK